MARRERNRVVVAVVAVAILAAAVYGPVALLAPLPATDGSATPVSASSDPAGPAPALPAEGVSGVTLAAGSAALSAGGDTPAPMAAAAKLVTALVVLDARPLDTGRTGPAITVTADDFAAFARYSAEGTRAIRVVTGDQWSQREAMQAMLIASSNNHAEMLARWAFGSEDAYLAAAAAWLAANELSGITVADSTGLSAHSTGTGADLARLAAIAMADPLIDELVRSSSATTLRGVTFENTIRYESTAGLLGISRSYTDEAGVCLLVAMPVQFDGEELTVYAALFGEPSYEQLDADVASLRASLDSALQRRALIASGARVGEYATPWSEPVPAVASEAVDAVDWAAAASTPVEVELEPVTTARAGTRVGSARVETRDGPATVAVELGESIGDPGPVWRLLHPGVVVPRFIAMVTGED